MDRLNRLVAITLRLQSRRIVRAEDLAEDFGISVRTVYRDLRALEEAGLPIYAEAGKGYSLLEGYHLPPVMFTQEEAAALFLGGEFTERLTDESLRGHARSALMKIRAVLPPERKEFIERVGSATAVYIPAPQPTFAPHAHLSLIQEAIAHRTVVEIAYQSGLRERTTRAVEPLGLVYYASHWHLIAWCRLRLDVRDFRSDRIMAIRPLGESFPERQDFSIREHVAHTMREGATTYPVRVRFTRAKSVSSAAVPPTGAATAVRRSKSRARSRTSSTTSSWRGSFVGTSGSTMIRALRPPFSLSTIPATA
ncbi:MAG: YafY family transcriptional regulator, partial [Chlorobi bacterium CHB2]|nr:YafY family transcriptional regulator [Chlorobi bacterium CHB2]